VIADKISIRRISGCPGNSEKLNFVNAIQSAFFLRNLLLSLPITADISTGCCLRSGTGIKCFLNPVTTEVRNQNKFYRTDRKIGLFILLTNKE